MILDEFGRDARAPRPSLFNTELIAFVNREILRTMKDGGFACRYTSLLVDPRGNPIVYPRDGKGPPRVGDTIKIGLPERFEAERKGEA